MPIETTYTYSISQDIPSGIVNAGSLQTEIQNSTIVTAISHISTSGDVLSIVFKDALSTADKTTLDNDATNPSGGLLGDHTGESLVEVPTVQLDVKTTTDHRLRVALEKGDGMRETFISFRWTDKTTWYEKSIQIENEIALNSGDNTMYTLTFKPLVDASHGKISNEDILVNSSGGSYKVKVEVNNGLGFVTQTENSPEITDGDFSVNYLDGTITFNSALLITSIVRVSYHYVDETLEGRSTFTIKPKEGRKLTIEVAEVQFSSDVVLMDSAVFQPYGYVQVFAPQLWTGHTPPGPYPTNTLIPIDTPKKWKTMYDYIDESVKSYPIYEAMGGSNWRAAVTPTRIFHWDYSRNIDLIASYGMEIRIFLEKDNEFGGTYATATLYGYSEPEEG